MKAKTPVGLAFVVAALSSYLAAIRTGYCDNKSQTDGT